MTVGVFQHAQIRLQSRVHPRPLNCSVLIQRCDMSNLSHHPLAALFSHQAVVWKLHISKKVDAFSVFYNLRFVRVQPQPKMRLQEGINWCKQFFQFWFVFGQDNKVVSVADIVFQLQLLFYKLVELIHIHVRKQLRGQVADRYTVRFARVREATNDFSEQPHHFEVFNSPCQYPKQYLVVDAVKKLPHIAFEHPARTRVVATHGTEHLLQPFNAFVCTLTDAAGKGVRDKAWFKQRVEQVEYSVMQDSVAHCGFVYVPQFGIGDIEAGVSTMLVDFVSQVAVQLENILLQIALKIYDIRFVAFLLLKLIPCRKQMLGRGHLLKYSFVRFHIYGRR